MSKKLTPLKMDSPEKFRAFLHKLWDELYWANFHCEILKELSRLCEEHRQKANLSAVFWTYTLRAHYQTAMVYLHRIKLYLWEFMAKESQEAADKQSKQKPQAPLGAKSL
jgi:hypothetical protein